MYFYPCTHVEVVWRSNSDIRTSTVQSQLIGSNLDKTPQLVIGFLVYFALFMTMKKENNPGTV